MKFFVDTADIDEIKDLASTGLLDGVTTNPSLVAKTGKDFIPLIEEICGVVSGPVSAEVAATDYKTMRKEAEVLRKISDHIAVKVPTTATQVSNSAELNTQPCGPLIRSHASREYSLCSDEKRSCDRLLE